MTGKKMLDNILVGLMLLSSIGVISLFYYTEVSYKRPPIDEAKEKETFLKTFDPKTVPTLLKIDKMVISLIPKDEKSNQRMKYLEIEAHLVLFKSEYLESMKTNVSVVLDRLIVISSKMGADELNTLTGKILLEDRLRKDINSIFGKPVVKSIFFSRYTVQ
jgi:flagellar FliL protein